METLWSRAITSAAADLGLCTVLVAEYAHRGRLKPGSSMLSLRHRPRAAEKSVVVKGKIDLLGSDSAKPRNVHRTIRRRPLLRRQHRVKQLGRSNQGSGSPFSFALSPGPEKSVVAPVTFPSPPVYGIRQRIKIRVEH
jgi:hypothetical protein